MRKETYNKLLNIAGTIASKRDAIKIDDLATKFNVDRRTMQGYLQTIRNNVPGFESLPGKNGGIIYHGEELDFSKLNNMPHVSTEDFV